MVYLFVHHPIKTARIKCNDSSTHTAEKTDAGNDKVKLTFNKMKKDTDYKCKIEIEIADKWYKSDEISFKSSNDSWEKSGDVELKLQANVSASDLTVNASEEECEDGYTFDLDSRECKKDSSRASSVTNSTSVDLGEISLTMADERSAKCSIDEMIIRKSSFDTGCTLEATKRLKVKKGHYLKAVFELKWETNYRRAYIEIISAYGDLTDEQKFHVSNDRTKKFTHYGKQYCDDHADKEREESFKLYVYGDNGYGADMIFRDLKLVSAESVPCE